MSINIRCAAFLALLVCLFSGAAYGQYCSASGGCTGTGGTLNIDSVQVGSINNTGTGCSGYADYTSLSTTMEIGTGYTITVTNGDPYDEDDQCGIWVDWNADNDFDDAGEAISTTGGPATFTGTITPPGGAALGDTRMRIRIMWFGSLEPCGDTTYGEVEDYTITVEAVDTGQIYGVKFNDLNGNGIREGGESVLSGWEVYLDLNNNGQWDGGEPKDVTDSNGYYEFLEIGAGTYVVAEVAQNGWVQTLPGWAGGRFFSAQFDFDNSITTIAEIDVNDGSVVNSFQMSYLTSAVSVQGLAAGPTSLFYTDLGFIDGEPYAKIWELDAETGSIIDVDELGFGSGLYFMGAAYLAGRVYIAKGEQGATQTDIAVWDPDLDQIVSTITVNELIGDALAGAADLGVLFCSIGFGDVIKIDPATGAVIETLDPGGGIYPGSGLAYFDGELIMGAAMQEPPTAYRIDANSGASLGTFQFPDNGAMLGLAGDGLTSEKYKVSIEDGEIVNLDFGNVELNSCRIEGIKWNDIDGDGRQDACEPGLENWSIYLDSNSNGQYDDGESIVVTDTNGEYEFVGLAAGFCEVHEVPKCGWTQSSPMLASWELIDVNKPRDLVFDAQRNLLYISTGNGTVERYDLAGGELTSPYIVGTSLYGMDITPDSSVLYVTEEQTISGQGMVHKVELSGGAVTDISYNLESLESGGSWDIKIGSHGKALVSPRHNGPMRDLDLSTDLFTVRTDIPGLSSGDINHRSRIFRTSDYSYLWVVGTSSDGWIFTYDAPTDLFVEEFHRGAYLADIPFAVSYDGSVIAYKTVDPLLWGTNSLWTYTNDFTALMAFDYGEGGIVFDSVGEVLYVACSDYGEVIVAFDTGTWEELCGIWIGEDIAAYSVFDKGEMAVSEDGRHLALTTSLGVRLFRNYHRVNAVVGRTVKDIKFGNKQDITGDFDKDKDVDAADLAIFTDAWLIEDSCIDIALGDGIVNLLDYAYFSVNWLIDEGVVVYDEGFETGDFSTYPWIHSGDSFWSVSSEESFEGIFSAKSGTLGSTSQESNLEITLNVEAGDIMFIVEILQRYGELGFYIDGEFADGFYDLKDWGQRSYPISAGIHTFKWSFSYDPAYGHFNAWLDAIRFPPVVGE